MMTINIALVGVDAEPLASLVVRFIPLSTPYADGAAIVLSGSKSVTTDDDGAASIELKRGNYRVRFGSDASNDVDIVIDTDSGAADLSSLVSDLDTSAPRKILVTATDGQLCEVQCQPSPVGGGYSLSEPSPVT